MAEDTTPLQIVTTLRGGVIKVKEGCAPDLAFFALWRDPPVSVGMPSQEWLDNESRDPNNGMSLEIERFVRMKILSPELQRAIKEELRIRHEQGLPIHNKEWADFTRTTVL